MKLRNLLLPVLFLTAGSLAARAALQEPDKAGPEHEVLKHMVGSFDSVLNAGPMAEKGSCTTKLLDGGMWAVMDFQSQMMGMPFVGHEVIGYDQHKKKYVSTWVDSMNSRMYVSEGTWDAATKTLTMTSLEADPNLGGKMVGVTKVVDADHHTYEMHVDKVGTPMMKIEYTRKK